MVGDPFSKNAQGISKTYHEVLEIVDNQFEKDYTNFNDFIPKHKISIKPRETKSM